VSPYLGAGLNATIFFDEKTAGALAGSKLSLDNSFGVAAQAGVDFALSSQWLINLDARWIDIDTDARLDGASLGSVAIDPYAFGVSVGYRFGKQ
jgi:outer membrane protein